MTASGNSAAAVASGESIINANPAATTPPSTVPMIRSTARCQVKAKNGCRVSTRVMVSQCA